MPDRRTTGGLVVALDGPGSSGKSSVGAAAALELGYRFVDTGLLYRALTWLALARGVGESDPEALVRLVPEVELIPDAEGRLAHVTVDGRDVTKEVHGPDVDEAVSAYSRVPEVRAALLDRQRRIAEAGRIIVAGRDIGTVVLPGADLKLYLDASVEERARRRAEEREIDPDGPDGEGILAELRRRDGIDSSRAVAPLRAAPDARVLHTDGNRFEDTVKLVVDEIRAAEGRLEARSGGRATARPTARAKRPPEERAPATEVERLDSHLSPLILLVSFIARIVARAVTRVRVEGDLEGIPREGPVILAANHASNADPVVVGAWLSPKLGRRMHWLGKRELFDWPFFGWLARTGGVHPVDRETADLDAFRLARRILDEGHVLMVFPEGTRSPDGSLQHAKDGVAMLALRTGAPIVPIAVAGSDRVWPRGRKLPRIGGRIVVRVGRPFKLLEEGGSTRSRAAKTAATGRLMGRIGALLPSRQRGVYAAESESEGRASREAAANATAD